MGKPVPPCGRTVTRVTAFRSTRWYRRSAGSVSRTVRRDAEPAQVHRRTPPAGPHRRPAAGREEARTMLTILLNRLRRNRYIGRHRASTVALALRSD
ncbi:hypothetical protein Athai_64720 [Actinocatenispora thailandica]|uniref:Uncharacterized protein n=1 Tax=Actinocatenispora thailandica TaxID=227318 RepID=A0A7R7DW43_9ACTN|nr:hypothetical protein Athai_64720 [Actinocatenispora thailandica]